VIGARDLPPALRWSIAMTRNLSANSVVGLIGAEGFLQTSIVDCPGLALAARFTAMPLLHSLSILDFRLTLEIGEFALVRDRAKPLQRLG
jgi:hypothetical protein